MFKILVGSNNPSTTKHNVSIQFHSYLPSYLLSENMPYWAKSKVDRLHYC